MIKRFKDKRHSQDKRMHREAESHYSFLVTDSANPDFARPTCEKGKKDKFVNARKPNTLENHTSFLAIL